MRILAASLLFFSASAAQAAPKVDYLFPAGGQRGTSVAVTLTGTFDSWPVAAWTSHPGLTVKADKKSGQCTITIAKDAPCGVHWLRFHDASGPSGLRPFLVNQVPEILEKEPNDEVKKPQPITGTAVVVNGRLDKNNEVDVFSMPLKKGQTLVASVEASYTLRSPMDAVLQIVSPDGFVLAQNHDFRDMDPQIAYSVPKDGDYLVRVFCFPSKPDTRVGLYGKQDCIYRLTLTSDPFLDYTWPLAVERGKATPVELIGWNIPADKRRTTIEPGPDADQVWVQPSGFAGGAFVRVEPHPTIVADKLAPGSMTVSGRLPGPGKKAVIHFDAKKGEKSAFRIEARELQFPLDPILIVRDAAGKSLQRVQSAKLNVDPALDFTAPADGTYSVEVRDLYEDGGPRHVFRLRRLTGRPEFEVSLASDRFAGTPGKPLEIAVNVNRFTVFKEPIEFLSEGLPESVRLEAIPGKDAKKLTLRLDGWKQAWNGSFRLWASVKDGQRHAVEAAVTELNANVPHLWLTVK